MNGTLEAISPRHFPSLPSARPFITAPAGPNVWRSCGPLVRGRLGAFPGNGFPAILPPIFVPSVTWPFIRVAYSLLALSRLGYSPNLALDGAYHTTSCRFRGITNLRRDKKSGALPLSASARRPGRRQGFYASPVSGTLFLLWKARAHRGSRLPDHQCLHNRRTQKGLTICLIFHFHCIQPCVISSSPTPRSVARLPLRLASLPSLLFLGDQSPQPFSYRKNRPPRPRLPNRGRGAR